MGQSRERCLKGGSKGLLGEGRKDCLKIPEVAATGNSSTHTTIFINHYISMSRSIVRTKTSIFSSSPFL